MRGATIRALYDLTEEGESPEFAHLTPVNSALSEAVREINPELVCRGDANTADNFNASPSVSHNCVLTALTLAAQIAEDQEHGTLSADQHPKRISNYGRWEPIWNIFCQEWQQKLDFEDRVKYQLYVTARADRTYVPTILRTQRGIRPRMTTGQSHQTFGGAAHWAECQGVALTDQLAEKAAA